MKGFRKPLHNLFGEPRKLSLLWVTGVLLVGVWVLVILEIRLSRESEHNDAQVEAITLSRLLDQQTEATLKGIDMGLVSLEELVEARRRKGLRITQKQFHELLLHRTRDVSELKGIHVVDENGKILATSYDEVPARNLSDRDYFIAHRDSPSMGLFISKPIIGRVNGGNLLILTRRVNGEHGEFRGIILGSLSVDELKRFYSTLNVGPHGSISLWNTDGMLLARTPDAPDLVGKIMTRTHIYELGRSRGKKSIFLETKSSLDGVTRLFNFAVLDHYPLMVGVGLSTDDVMQAWRLRTGFYLIALCLITAGFVFVIWRYWKSLELLEERQVQAVQNAQMSSLGIMAAGVAHEINNPLTTIQLNAEYLQHIQVDPERVRKIAGKIVETVQRITRIVQGLKTLSRKADHDPHVPADIRGVLEETLLLCAEKFHHHQVWVDSRRVENAVVPCNRAQMAQVFLNLLHNSFDAISEQDAKWIRIESERQAGMLQIRFTDSGPGIPEEVAQKIMLPFFTTKEVGSGTGLGLSISRAILEAHGGKLFLDRKSSNTCFVVELPMREMPGLRVELGQAQKAKESAGLSSSELARS